MTICLAIKCKHAEFPCVLFAADTQESDIGQGSALKCQTTKLYPIVDNQICVAFAGDVLVANEAVNDINSLLIERMRNGKKQSQILSLDQFLLNNRKEIGNTAYATYKKYSKRGENPGFELLLATADKDSAILYVDCEGKSQIHEHFAILGSGRAHGGELLLREFMKKEMLPVDAASLATLVVTTVGSVDLYVGGQPDMYWCEQRKIWEFDKDDYPKIFEETKERWALLKEAWGKMQEDENLKDNIRKLLT